MTQTNVEKFKKQNYCKIENAVSYDIISLFTQYALFDEIQDFKPDGHQVVGAHAKYADPAMESLLIHLRKIVEENTGLELYPTYSFYRVYRPGDELKKHFDRPSCEISATMSFKYSYEKEKFQWPIFMNGTPIYLEPGDMAIYKGMEVEHWRDPLITDNQDDWHVQGFFHYVNANGQFAEWKYDKRKSPGRLR